MSWCRGPSWQTLEQGDLDGARKASTMRGKCKLEACENRVSTNWEIHVPSAIIHEVGDHFDFANV